MLTEGSNVQRNPSPQNHSLASDRRCLCDARAHASLVHPLSQDQEHIETASSNILGCTLTGTSRVSSHGFIYPESREFVPDPFSERLSKGNEECLMLLRPRTARTCTMTTGVASHRRTETSPGGQQQSVEWDATKPARIRCSNGGAPVSEASRNRGPPLQKRSDTLRAQGQSSVVQFFDYTFARSRVANRHGSPSNQAFCRQ